MCLVDSRATCAWLRFLQVGDKSLPTWPSARFTPAAAGDFGFKVLTSSDPAEKTEKLSLAMMAIIGMFFQGMRVSKHAGCQFVLVFVSVLSFIMFSVCGPLIVENPQDGLTGSAWGDWANYTASPLRAFENEPWRSLQRLFFWFRSVLLVFQPMRV